MTDTQTDTQIERTRTWHADPERVRVEDAEDGLFAIRMPLASTAEARDGRALGGDIIEGWRQQIEDEPLPLFLDHGFDGLSTHRYGALSKVGYWTDAEVVERNGELELEASAVMADPDELDGDVGAITRCLRWLRTQAELGIPLASSAGWSENTGDRDVPGGYDLMEASIVGIPSDERTTTSSADPVAVARAVEAASEDFDAEAFYDELTRTMTDTDDAGEEPADDRDAPDGDPAEWRMTEAKYDRLMQRMDTLEAKNDEELEMLREMYDGDGEDNEADEDDDDDRDEQPDDERDGGDDDVDETERAETRTVEIDGEAVDPEEALERLRSVADDSPDPGESETRNVVEDDEDEAGDEETRESEPDEQNDGPTFSFTE